MSQYLGYRIVVCSLDGRLLACMYPRDQDNADQLIEALLSTFWFEPVKFNLHNPQGKLIHSYVSDLM